MNRIITAPWADYELIDAGNNNKLERWGTIITIRPDINAYFEPQKTMNEWLDLAHFQFIESKKGNNFWKELKPNTSKNWAIDYDDIKINLHLTKYKHIGLFPEQRTNWDFIRNNIIENDNFLNLFAYTGVASLIARKCGGKVVHCDSVKQVISWSRENMVSSGLDSIRWILDDALTFANREIKRENRYKGIIMDPPAYGLGVKNERWKIEEKFPELLQAALKLREDNGFIIINTYSPRLNEYQIKEIANKYISTEKISITTLSIKSSTGKILDYGLRTLITSAEVK